MLSKFASLEGKSHSYDKSLLANHHYKETKLLLETKLIVRHYAIGFSENPFIGERGAIYFVVLTT